MNQVWLGCPQPLCLVGSIDTVYFDLNTNNKYYFRGRFAWKVGKETLTTNAILIKDLFQFKDGNLDLNFGYFDTTFLYKNETYLIKVSSYNFLNVLII